MRRALIRRPERRLHHHQPPDARPPVVRAHLERVHHGHAIVNRDKARAGGLVGVAREKAGFRAANALHHRLARRADTALGPDFLHDRKRFPDGKGGQTRRARLDKPGHRRDQHIDRIDDPVAPCRQNRIEFPLAREHLKERCLPARAHGLLGAGDILRRDRPRRGGRRHALAAALPLAQRDRAKHMDRGGRP